MLKKNPTYFLSLIFLIFSFEFSQAQNQASKTLKIIKSDRLRSVGNIQKLINNVVMKQDNTMIYCDSAYFYEKENKAKLFGNVRMNNPVDTVSSTSRYADYDGNTQLAKLRDNVVFKKASTTLYTDFLDYDRRHGIADYYNFGKVVDSTNVLTSQKGRYETQIEKITFQDNVILINPEYTLKSNILYYYTLNKTAETEGLTNIRSPEGDELNAKKGSFYDTQNKLFRFFQGDVENETSRVSGDTLFYDDTKKYYEARENVSIFNKERNLEIFGDKGQYWEGRKYSEVFGNALVQKYFKEDTLYMAADTLISQDSESAENRYMLAFPNTRMIKGNLSGRADSTAYVYSDSTIYLYRDPLLWNNKSQISADSINFVIANEDIDKVFLKENSFVITADTIANFNQIKGRQMTGHFAEGDISRLDVDGNGESLYYALENDTTVQGINTLLCGKIIMHFENGNVSKINHTINPEASFIPPHLITEKVTQLKGFSWRIEERPDMAMINEWRKPREKEENPSNLFNEPNIRIPYPNEDEIQEIINEWLNSQNKNIKTP
ncbi:OstA-like protein [Echinicola salinicaeni]|uniref:OstA-like protein n=1 Tax=Echinicola salinicaeni TaxID=2762757 RepID=UPI001644E412|nr:OstA-like protein [Echinicola salinicaeni]